MPPTERSEESIFASALEKPTPAERAAFLEGACSGDASLRERVEGLLRSHEDAGSFLNPAPVATVDFRPILENVGSVIGRYKLLQKIGEGGFGAVYMAEQKEPVKRRIALKIIKLGMDTNDVIARFEAERQALALMDHPNIAKVLDAGTTENGRPYFVMELVKGVAITEFCDANNLTARERLELFTQVCGAVQHAHRKGVIHRDLKPSNILVTLHDGVPVPKVIDFGVAKALNQELTERTLFTAYGHMIGTPQYMSPEQAEMSGLDVDTRSDVYSLGVLLFELLTGTTPLDSESLRKAGYLEMQRLIKDQEAPRPSLRLSTLGETLTIVAKHRQTDPRQLQQLLRGELDWIVLKALEKERGRRYESPSSFAADIRRYLEDKPVEACPPSLRYRARKFLRRNRGAVLAAAALLTALTLGLLGTTVGLVRAVREAHRASDFAAEAEAQRAEALAAQSAAQAERDKAVEAREKLRAPVYAGQMRRLPSAWAVKSLPGARRLLEETRPGPGESDLRGFEWHYWDRLVAREEGMTRTLRPLATHGKLLSTDGRLAAGIYAHGEDDHLGAWETSSGRQLLDQALPRPSRGAWTASAVAGSGSHVAAAVGIGEIRVYEVASGREVRVIRVDGDPPPTSTGLHRLALSRGGERVALAIPHRGEASPLDGTLAGRVLVWDVASGRELARLGAPPPWRPGNLAFSPDATRLAATHWPNDRDNGSVVGLRVFEITTGRELLARELPGWICQSIPAFSPDGTLVATPCFVGKPHYLGSVGEPKSQVLVTEVLTGRDVQTFAAVDHFQTVDLALEGARLSLACLSLNKGNGLYRGDLATGRLERLGPCQNGQLEVGLGVREEGKRLVVLTLDGTVREWDLENLAPTGPERGPTFANPAHQAKLSPDGRWLAVGSAVAEGEGKAWEISIHSTDDAGEVTRVRVPLLPGPALREMEFARDGSALALTQLGGTNPTDLSVSIWDLPSGSQRFSVSEPGWGKMPSYRNLGWFLPDGSKIALCRRKDGARLWEVTLEVRDSQTGAVLHRFAPDAPAAPANPQYLRTSPDGRELVIAGRHEGRVAVAFWNLGAGRLDRMLLGGPMRRDDEVSAPVFLPGGRELLVRRSLTWAGSSPGTTHTWDLATGREVRVMNDDTSRVFEQGVSSPDGRRFALTARLASNDKGDGETASITLIDTTTGLDVLILSSGVKGIIRQVVFTPDGHQLIAIAESQNLPAPPTCRLLVWDATPRRSDITRSP